MSFRFKQFYVDDSRCAMKVGTDGVLLGAWAGLATYDTTKGLATFDLRLSTTILDIGTGCGLIALMMAQRFPAAHITAIDINAAAAEQAADNFAASPWSNRFQAVHTSLQDFTPQQHFNLIVCNPPFFTETLKAPDPDRAIARHADTLPLDLLLRHARQLLTDNGILSLILPAAALAPLKDSASGNLLAISRVCHVFSKPGKAERRVMAELCHISHQSPNPTHHTDLSAQPDTPYLEETLFIESDTASRSEQYSALTQDFYL